jgi:SAM-dependent methyltransferase
MSGSPVEPNFDRIARLYRWLEYLTLGSALTHCRNHFLPILADGRRALILGDGDGRFTARLLSAYPNLCVDAVDLSTGMLRLLTRQAQAAHPTASARLRTLHADARTLRVKGTYDLVVSHFFLDCLTQTELDDVVLRLRHHLATGALWAVSDFRIPPGAKGWFARALVRALYLAFRVLTGLRVRQLPDHQSALQSASLYCGSQHLSLGGLLTTELWTNAPAYSPSMQLPPQKPPAPPDPVPDPEPAGPSLPEPDPGVFRPTKPQPKG